jgi:DNA-binding response OmpR family regulator
VLLRWPAEGVRRAQLADRQAPPLLLVEQDAVPPETLVGGFGAVVSRDRLTRAGWPAGAPRRSALNVHVLRLRRRIDPLGLVIRTVRSRGYLLESSFLAAVASTALRQAAPRWAQ